MKKNNLSAKIKALFENLRRYGLIGISVIIGAVVILYPLYRRILRNPLPRELPTELWQKQELLLLLVYVIITTIWLYLLFKSAKLLLSNCFNIGAEPQENALILKLKKAYDDCIDSFYTAFEHIIPKPLLRWFYNKIMCPLVVFLLNILNTRFRMMAFIFCFNVLPKLVFFTIFAYDVIYLHTFTYIYKFAIILIIPLLLRYLDYWVSMFSTNNIEQIDTKVRLDIDSSPYYGCVIDYFDKCCKVELKGSLEDIHYKIATTFQLQNEALGFRLILEPNWYHKHRRIFGDVHNLVDLLNHFYFDIYFEIFPIMIFSNFYYLSGYKLLLYFSVVRSFLYALLWIYMLWYTF